MIDRKFPLPSPRKERANIIFYPTIRVSKVIPFGYEVDPEDDDILLPIPEELLALEKAKKFLKKYSYREVAHWLTHETGRSISHQGLKERLERERRNKRVASIYDYYAQRYKEAMEKAQKLHHRLGGKELYSEIEPDPEDYDSSEA